MALKRLKYLVVLDVPATDDHPAGEIEHEIEVRHADQLRGELEAAKQGLPGAKEAPLNNVTVWVWCAMVRLGLYGQAYKQFQHVDLVGFEQVKDSQEDVDPTQPGPSSGSA